MVLAAKVKWYVMAGHTFVRALRTVRLVTAHIEDSALDSDVGRVVCVGAYDLTETSERASC